MKRMLLSVGVAMILAGCGTTMQPTASVAPQSMAAMSKDNTQAVSAMIAKQFERWQPHINVYMKDLEVKAAEKKGDYTFKGVLVTSVFSNFTYEQVEGTYDGATKKATITRKTRIEEEK